MTTPPPQPPPHQPLARPEWLPEGASHCPSPGQEKVINRMHVDYPNTYIRVFQCAHGEWLNQSDAWQAHEALFPELPQTLNQPAQITATIHYTDLDPNATLANQLQTRRTTPELIEQAVLDVLATTDLAITPPADLAYAISTRYTTLHLQNPTS